MTAELLIVAGEASGDRLAAAVARAARDRFCARAWGMGGSACRSAGVELVGDVALSALGWVGAD